MNNTKLKMALMVAALMGVGGASATELDKAECERLVLKHEAYVNETVAQLSLCSASQHHCKKAMELAEAFPQFQFPRSAMATCLGSNEALNARVRQSTKDLSNGAGFAASVVEARSTNKYR